MELFERARKHRLKTAVIEQDKQYAYTDLVDRAGEIATFLLDGQKDLQEARIAFMVTPGAAYITAQWGIWMAGGVAVPLGLMHPGPELAYELGLTGAKAIIADETFLEAANEAADSVGIPVLHVEEMKCKVRDLPDISPDRRAMILFTSGTTSRPKGVVSTHANIQSRITCLVEAWAWEPDDRILGILPLHHTHGIINIVACALWTGATIDFLPRFDAEAVWGKFREGNLTVFMAVPTIYAKLIRFWEESNATDQVEFSEACHNFRLMVSGSAALPVSVLELWEEITHQRLLERYGMTEIGMALSNPYEGERRAGTVGQPLPGVEVELRDDSGNPVADGEQGEIHIKGKNVFLEYWDNPEATAAAFTADGWFKTGDIAILEKGYYRILGRSSIDIIKSGGFKISALEIEEVIRKHPSVREVAVIGLPDAEWGEKIAAALVLRDEEVFPLEEIKALARKQLAPYKIPKEWLSLNELPRNALGKVMKPMLGDKFVG